VRGGEAEGCEVTGLGTWWYLEWVRFVAPGIFRLRASVGHD